MLTLTLIRETSEFVIDRLHVKNFKGEEIIHQILDYDRQRRELQNNQDNRQAE